MIAADDDQRIIPLADSLQFIKEQPQHPIQRQYLPKVIAHILANLVHIRKKRWHLTLQIIRLQPPQVLARTLCPLAMRIGRTEPVTERLGVLSLIEERLKILHPLTAQLGLRLLRSFTRLNHLRRIL